MYIREIKLGIILIYIYSWQKKIKIKQEEEEEIAIRSVNSQLYGKIKLTKIIRQINLRIISILFRLKFIKKNFLQKIRKLLNRKDLDLIIFFLNFLFIIFV